MAEGDQPPLKRARLSTDDIEKMSRDELVQRCIEQESHIESLASKPPEANDVSGSEMEEKLRLLQQESARRENVLVMRLTAKEQELQEIMNQNEEMKRAQNPSIAQLRGMLLDPAINLMFQRMKKEMEQSKEKLEQAQNDLAAWKFTPDGQTGKRLMAKCRMLLQENSELGRVISAGRTAKLEGEIALGKKFVEEMKQSQAETDEFLVEMDEDVEGLQSTIYLLQQQLKEAKEQIQQLQQTPQENGARTTYDSESDVGEQRTITADMACHRQQQQQQTNGNMHADTEHSHALTATSAEEQRRHSEQMDTEQEENEEETWTGGKAGKIAANSETTTLQNGMMETQGSNNA